VPFKRTPSQVLSAEPRRQNVGPLADQIPCELNDPFHRIAEELTLHQASRTCVSDAVPDGAAGVDECGSVIPLSDGTNHSI
jgi:hypothetical protein